MNPGVEIADNVFWVGVNDTETERFEALWPMPRGISYNAYLIRDEKVALIDAAKGLLVPGFLDQVNGLLGAGEVIDFLTAKSKEVFPETFTYDFQGESRQYVQEGNRLVVTFIFASSLNSKNFLATSTTIGSISTTSMFAFG